MSIYPLLNLLGLLLFAQTSPPSGETLIYRFAKTAHPLEWREWNPWYDWLSQHEILYWDSENCLQKIDLTTGKAQRWLELKTLHAPKYPYTHFTFPVLSPNRRTLHFTMAVGGATFGDREMGIISITTRQARWIQPEHMGGVGGIWSLDNQHWVYLEQNMNPSHREKYPALPLISHDTHHPHTPPCTFAVQGWSEDSTESRPYIRLLGYRSPKEAVTFAFRGEESWIGLIQEKEGKLVLSQQQRVLCPEGLSSHTPVLSNNGKQIAWIFSSSTVSPLHLDYEIWVSDSEGGALHRVWKMDSLVTDRYIQCLRWLPDDSALSFLIKDTLFQCPVR